MKNRIAGILSICCASLVAQTFPKSQETCIFDGGNLVLIEKQGDSIEAHIESPGQKESKTLKYPSWAIKGDHFDGRFWAIQREKGSNGKIILRTFFSSDCKNWNIDGQLTAEKASSSFFLYPIERDRYLLVATSYFTKGEISSPLAIGRRDDKNDINLRKVLDLGLKEPYASTNQSDPKVLPKDPFGISAINQKYLTSFLQLGKSMVVRYPGGLAIVSNRTGYIWLLNSHKESEDLKLIKIFPSVTEDRLDKGDIEIPILGCQPRPNGHLLIASRSEEAVLMARKEFPEPEMNDDEFSNPNSPKHKLTEQVRNKALLKYPEILWWDLDPATGKLTKEEAPLNIPNKILDIGLMSKFRFRFKPDGNLLIAN